VFATVQNQADEFNFKQ